MRDELNQKTDFQNLETEQDKESLSFIPHPSSWRILLWDIDGTLVIAPRGGAYKEYFAPAMTRVYGSTGILWNQLKVSGMTDLQIVYESLEPEGFTVEQIFAKTDEFTQALGEEIKRVCDLEEQRFVSLPGTHEILRATAENPLFINALLTGNLIPAARYKLAYVGLDKYFDFAVGAFGHESHRRIDLPAVAQRTISAKFDYEFAPAQFIIIGDTPNDILTARHFGAKAVAVATGRNTSADILLPLNPDYLFENLLDTAKVIQILETI